MNTEVLHFVVLLICLQDSCVLAISTFTFAQFGDIERWRQEEYLLLCAHQLAVCLNESPNVVADHVANILIKKLVQAVAWILHRGIP